MCLVVELEHKIQPFYNHLRDYWRSEYDGIPDVITRDNVNAPITFKWDKTAAATRLLTIAVKMGGDDGYATAYLLSLGAQVTAACIYSCSSISVLEMIMESGQVTPRLLNKQGYQFPVNVYCEQRFQLMADYGCKPPFYVRAYDPDRREYLEQVQRRVARCRRALVAMLYYCRRSSYPALRAGYVELAKWILRMRGGEGCGLRSKKWNL